MAALDGFHATQQVLMDKVQHFSSLMLLVMTITVRLLYFLDVHVFLGFGFVACSSISFFDSVAGNVGVNPGHLFCVWNAFAS